MPVLLATLLYWIRQLRRPMQAGLKRRHVGSSAILLLGFGVVVMGDRQRPVRVSAAYAFGEIAGVLAVYLTTWTLLLATRARWLEPWFGAWIRCICGTGAQPLLRCCCLFRTCS